MNNVANVQGALIVAGRVLGALKHASSNTGLRAWMQQVYRVRSLSRKAERRACSSRLESRPAAELGDVVATMHARRVLADIAQAWRFHETRRLSAECPWCPASDVRHASFSGVDRRKAARRKAVAA